jgi:TatD DNase family protein
LAEQYDFISTTVGVHPHEAKLVTDAFYEKLEQACTHPKVVAWGEIGLDYHYDNSPRDVQREVFRQQLRRARRRGLPVIIHSRAAEEDTITILRAEWGDAGLPGIMHCFSGSAELAQAAIDLGFLISFSGIVTFKTAGDLRQVARALPLDKILIETDSPFLAPVPHRGRRNEPAFVVEVARCLAQVKGIATEEVARRTTLNFKRLFKLDMEPRMHTDKRGF